MRFFKVLFFAVILSGLVSCSYFQKKKCEETNWYQHGYNSAMSGKRITGDTYVKKCEEVGANVRFDQLDSGFKEGVEKYCSTQSAYAVGRAGDDLNIQLCDAPGLAKKLQKAHVKGREAMCKNDGFKFGRSGKEYKNQCPPKLEKSFLAKYYKGRVQYLRKEIAKLESEKDSLRSKINNLEREKALVEGQLMATARTSSQTRRTRTYNARTGTYVESSIDVSGSDDNYRSDLRRKLDNKNYEIRNAKNRLAEIDSRIRQMRAEMENLNHSGSDA